jgi:hypothetical protein
MFTKLTDTNKAAIFSVLVLLMAGPYGSTED